MPSEIAQLADFSQLRYAQCWEDADVLLAALDLQPEQIGLAIAAAGDNVMAMLSRAPHRLIAVDFNPAQIASLELRVAAYRVLAHPELLLLLGSRPALARPDKPHPRLLLYQRCRPYLSPRARQFWDRRTKLLQHGLGHLGKFERYLALFRRVLLPRVHSPEIARQLLRGGEPAERERFYTEVWDTWRWRSLFRLFFSRPVLGRLGRDPSFFRYAEGDVADDLLERTRYACTVLNPAENPYLQWIGTGCHLTALPYALRPENFTAIRANLDRLEWHCIALEDFLATWSGPAIDGFNLSNIFEYMSPANYRALLQRIVQCSAPGSRLVYWNLFVPRQRPPELAGELRPLTSLAQTLSQQDKVFFYRQLVVEEVTASVRA